MTKPEKQIIKNQILIMEALKRGISYPHVEEGLKTQIMQSEKLLKGN